MGSLVHPWIRGDGGSDSAAQGLRIIWWHAHFGEATWKKDPMLEVGSADGRADCVRAS